MQLEHQGGKPSLAERLRQMNEKLGAIKKAVADFKQFKDTLDPQKPEDAAAEHAYNALRDDPDKLAEGDKHAIENGEIVLDWVKKHLKQAE